ncbi:hypothetical protein BKA14_000669 [Actinoplanes abujensis]|uniref:Uncharacterized protein n=1 Tax=Paractinoplanes abujensis TaxID=882441 RepID=A0A7W7G1E0_9ACTN|nr:hypothetical protein [Actinoplanes abujensis]
MGQMSLFSRAAISQMRDRTKARNYSPGNEEFRREHQQRRAWGLQRRHAEKARWAARHPAAVWPAGRRPVPPHGVSGNIVITSLRRASGVPLREPTSTRARCILMSLCGCGGRVVAVKLNAVAKPPGSATHHAVVGLERQFPSPVPLSVAAHTSSPYRATSVPSQLLHSPRATTIPTLRLTHFSRSEHSVAHPPIASPQRATSVLRPPPARSSTPSPSPQPMPQATSRPRRAALPRPAIWPGLHYSAPTRRVTPHPTPHATSRLTAITSFRVTAPHRRCCIPVAPQRAIRRDTTPAARHPPLIRRSTTPAASIPRSTTPAVPIPCGTPPRSTAPPTPPPPQSHPPPRSTNSSAALRRFTGLRPQRTVPRAAAVPICCFALCADATSPAASHRQPAGALLLLRRARRPAARAGRLLARASSSRRPAAHAGQQLTQASSSRRPAAHAGQQLTQASSSRRPAAHAGQQLTQASSSRGPAAHAGRSPHLWAAAAGSRRPGAGCERAGSCPAA